MIFIYFYVASRVQNGPVLVTHVQQCDDHCGARQFDGHPEVWVYEQPNRFRQIGAIPNGTLVEFLGAAGGWFSVFEGGVDICWSWVGVCLL